MRETKVFGRVLDYPQIMQVKNFPQYMLECRYNKQGIARVRV